MFQDSFCMFKAIETMVFFANVFFLYQMCTIPEKDLNIDDYKSKSTWKWENSFKNTFEHWEVSKSRKNL